MEEKLIYIVEHNSLGVRGVFTDPAKVIEYLKEQGIDDQGPYNETWNASTLVFAWLPNTIDFDNTFTPAAFVKQHGV